MCSLKVDESDKRKTWARKAIKLSANSKPAPKLEMDPVSWEDRANPWYFTHT